MPKIVIKEYDKTSAGVGLYSNFTVLVPGFVDLAVVDTTKFDDNGVYEVASKDDFVKYVGKVAANKGIIAPAVAPTLYGDIFYYEDTDSDSDDIGEARLWLLNIIRNLPEDLKVYEVSENGEHDIGELRDVNFTYEEITEAYILEHEDYDPEDKAYAEIKEGKNDEGIPYIGQDQKTGAQYGNQIAYELLKLGYTILYKKLDQISDLQDESFWKALKDKSLYDFRYVITDLLTGNDTANDRIRELAHFKNTDPDDSGRGDCTALCDIDIDAYEGKTQAEAIKGIEDAEKKFVASKYAALFAPYVIYAMAKDGDYEDNRKFPATFHYLACAAKAAENYNEWYAIAGYTRGVSDFSIESVGCKLGEDAVNALEPRWIDKVDKAVNIIVKIKNNYYLWGNRTAEALGKKDSENGNLRASHFLNIRQLCSTIKKQVYITCRRYTFDPNSDILWSNFCSAIRPLLEKMKADQGITDYKFVKIKTKEKGVLKAKIRIVPIEAVEDFDISLTLEDSITGVATDIDETIE